MPNQPKTPARSVRISDSLWTTARDVAHANGETVTDVVVRALDDYVNRHTATR